MISFPFTVSGRVQSGHQQARVSGYRTANLTFSGPLDIPEGIYCARTTVDPQDAPIQSIVFYGIPHALSEVIEPRFEVHLFEKDIDLYGQELVVELIAFIRENKKFSDHESLKRAIAGDIALAKKYFGYRPFAE